MLPSIAELPTQRYACGRLDGHSPVIATAEWISRSPRPWTIAGALLFAT
jgi:hypothetical protein